MIRFQSPTKHYPREPHKTLEYLQVDYRPVMSIMWVFNWLRLYKAMEQCEGQLAEGCIGIRLVISSLSPYPSAVFRRQLDRMSSSLIKDVAARYEVGS
uniref:Bm8555 n=1 Tax=Brugia malayi TaxID=6279 RepID=A0A1I9G010_BRUMA|nr:Bm8555 [Brugia malayi]